jgi:hypothetical protein
MAKNKNNRPAMWNRVRTLAVCTLLALAALLVSSCAGNAPKSDPVLERAQLRWDSILSGDFDTAYSLYSPGYRSTHSRVDFEIALRMQRVKWTSAEYVSQECAESRCIVRFKVGFSVNQPVPGLNVFESSNMVDDIWVRTQDEWWFVPPVKK